MPISYIFAVVGHISRIRYPKIQDIAEMIMRIIPIIPIIKNPFFVSIFYLPSFENFITIINSFGVYYKNMQGRGFEPKVKSPPQFFVKNVVFTGEKGFFDAESGI